MSDRHRPISRDRFLAGLCPECRQKFDAMTDHSLGFVACAACLSRCTHQRQTIGSLGGAAVRMYGKNPDALLPCVSTDCPAGSPVDVIVKAGDRKIVRQADGENIVRWVCR